MAAVGLALSEAILCAFEYLKAAFQSLLNSWNGCWGERSIQPLVHGEEKASSFAEEIVNEEGEEIVKAQLQLVLERIKASDEKMRTMKKQR